MFLVQPKMESLGGVLKERSYLLLRFHLSVVDMGTAGLRDSEYEEEYEPDNLFRVALMNQLSVFIFIDSETLNVVVVFSVRWPSFNSLGRTMSEPGFSLGS